MSGIGLREKKDQDFTPTLLRETQEPQRKAEEVNARG